MDTVSCCVGYIQAKEIIAQVVRKHHPSDAKLFVAHREAISGLEYKIILGIVVKPDEEKNTQMFEDLIRLQERSDLCVKVLRSQIDSRDANMIDLFLVEIRTEIDI